MIYEESNCFLGLQPTTFHCKKLHWVLAQGQALDRYLFLHPGLLIRCICEIQILHGTITSTKQKKQKPGQLEIDVPTPPLKRPLCVTFVRCQRKLLTSSLALAQEGTKPFVPFHPVRPVAERVRLGLGKYKSEGKVLKNCSEHFHHIVPLFLNFSAPSLVLILIDSYSQVVVHFWDAEQSNVIGQIQGSLEDDDKNQLEYTSAFPGFTLSQSHPQAAGLKGCDKSSLGSSSWAIAKCKEYTFNVDQLLLSAILPTGPIKSGTAKKHY